MVINTNVLALNSHRALKNVGAAQSTSSARLSSGLRINSAADDAAGLAISEKMRGQIRGLNMASKNAQDGSSLIQTAEGGMQQIGDMVQRIRELTVQAANDTNDTATGDRTKIQTEISELISEIDSMANRVEFNNKTLLNGSTGKLTFQVGANSGQTVNVSIGKMTSKSLTLNDLKKVDLATADANTISANLTILDNALTAVNSARAALGAKQNRLEYTMKSLDISSENLSASESRIRDTDMAKEMMNLTKSNVLSSAATSMLSQANQQPQNVLQLLR
ncbi:MAG: flagellin [Clostridiales bacterium]|jgi:flagellin|nr:flagellin [Clostridiales bacterium]